MIAKYSGDGTIQHLSSPGPLGIDGIAIKFPNIDLSRNHRAIYSLENLPAGSAYMMYFVVPDPAPLNEIMQNELELKIMSNGELVRSMQLVVGDMINNQGAGLNRFYCLEGHRGHAASSEVGGRPAGNYSIELMYVNNHVDNKVTGYLLLERGGFK